MVHSNATSKKNQTKLNPRPYTAQHSRQERASSLWAFFLTHSIPLRFLTKAEPPNFTAGGDTLRAAAANTPGAFQRLQCWGFGCACWQGRKYKCYLQQDIWGRQRLLQMQLHNLGPATGSSTAVKHVQCQHSRQTEDSHGKREHPGGKASLLQLVCGHPFPSN